MLLTNQKTINYEKFITLNEAYDDFIFACANVEILFK